MTSDTSAPGGGDARPASPIDSTTPSGHPFDAEIESERAGWYELQDLIRPLDVEAIAKPGYYRDPDWSVVTLVGHLGMWLAEAGIQLERIGAGTYEPRDVDIDGLNAAYHTAMSGQPWHLISTQAQASRSRMLEVWYGLSDRTDAAAWWVAKAGADHYREHLPRLREWTAELRPGNDP